MGAVLVGGLEEGGERAKMTVGGALVPPSRTFLMDIAEFCDRLHAGRGGRSAAHSSFGSRVCWVQ